ncbi:fibroblast growth factor receptor 1-like [Ptychodera flava]|uniref:fibroblast growth factor receptor 1-like n=1 Tax=Ptychodera flava TaxID=63121 RepID=UPI00396A4AE6
MENGRKYAINYIDKTTSELVILKLEPEDNGSYVCQFTTTSDKTTVTSQVNVLGIEDPQLNIGETRTPINRQRNTSTLRYHTIAAGYGIEEDIGIVVTLSNQELRYGDTAELRDSESIIRRDLDNMTSILKILDIRFEDSGLYSCLVHSNNGVIVRSDIEITVNDVKTTKTVRHQLMTPPSSTEMIRTLQGTLFKEPLLPSDKGIHVKYIVIVLSGMLVVGIASVALYAVIIRKRRHIECYDAANDTERTNEISPESIEYACSTLREDNFRESEDQATTDDSKETCIDEERPTEIQETKEPLLQSKDHHQEPFDVGSEFNYNRLQFPKDNILGRGEFGVVRKAFVSNAYHPSGRIAVAVKCLKGNASVGDREDFLRELNIMKLLQSGHPNVVKLLGCCTADGK